MSADSADDILRTFSCARIANDAQPAYSNDLSLTHSARAQSHNLLFLELSVLSLPLSEAKLFPVN